MSDQLAPSDAFAVSATEAHASYDWNQNVEEVNLNVSCRIGLSAKQVKCQITSGHVRLQCVGSGKEEKDTLLDDDTVEHVKPDESFWTIDSRRGVINLTLQKAKEGQSWPSVFKGHQALDGHAQESEQKRLLLERFQLEHPGFDFSGAEVNGTCPDPSSFMGGFR